MNPGRKPSMLTERELPIMKALWTDGPLFVREIVERFPEPRPHQNTVATLIKILEEKGHVTHESVGNAFRYSAVTPRSEFRDRSLRSIVSDFFDNSYKNAVSALVEEEKISIDELREIIEIMQRSKKS